MTPKRFNHELTAIRSRLSLLRKLSKGGTDGRTDDLLADAELSLDAIEYETKQERNQC
jgi:hypothetical protein